MSASWKAFFLSGWDATPLPPPPPAVATGGGGPSHRPRIIQHTGWVTGITWAIANIDGEPGPARITPAKARRAAEDELLLVGAF